MLIENLKKQVKARERKILFSDDSDIKTKKNVRKRDLKAEEKFDLPSNSELGFSSTLSVVMGGKVGGA